MSHEYVLSIVFQYFYKVQITCLLKKVSISEVSVFLFQSYFFLNESYYDKNMLLFQYDDIYVFILYKKNDVLSIKKMF